MHLLAAADLPVWTGAMGAVPAAGGQSAALLTPAQTDAVVAAIAAAPTRRAGTKGTRGTSRPR